MSMSTDAVYINKTVINAICNITNGTGVAASTYMTQGSLTLGGTDINYGVSTSWSSNTAGLLLECADYTDIVVHDSSTRLSSLIYYDGPLNRIRLGRNKGWGVT